MADIGGDHGSGGIRQRLPEPGRWRGSAGWLAAAGAAGLLAAAFGPVAAAPPVRLAMLDPPATPRRPQAANDVTEALAARGAPLRIRGTVGSGIYRSARAAGAPPSAVQQYLRALDAQLLLEEDVLPTDAFDLVIATGTSGTARAGDLLYAGLSRDGRPRAQLLRWGREGRLQAVEDLAANAQSGFAAPLAGRITSRFGVRRHPILGHARMHAGIDIAARHGAPVRATAAGRVVFAGRHGGHGRYVRLAHSDGFASGYAHLSRMTVAPGMQVRAGEVIGYVGSTGLSTGPHLHYELYRGGKAVNPRPVIAAAVNARTGEGAAVRARLAALMRLPPIPPLPIPAPVPPMPPRAD